MFAYGVYLTTRVLKYGYDLGIKDQGQIFLKSVLRGLFLHFLIKGILM